MEMLKVENLCKTYGEKETKVEALKDVNFTVSKGDFIAIIGPSGSGKSTLLHILGGVERPSDGHIYVEGEDIVKQSENNLALYRRRQVGLIYQFYNLIPILNVKENISLPVMLDGKKPDEAYLEELIHVLGLENRVNHLPNELSGGQQQRVSIGRALIYHPSLLLADEPTGNLDSKASEEIMELLEISNQKYGQTIIMITHDEDLAMHAKRIISIEDGQITKDERLREI